MKETPHILTELVLNWYYVVGKTEDEIASTLHLTVNKVHSIVQQALPAARTESHYIDTLGYVQARRPAWYVGGSPGCYVPLHDLVICDALDLNRVPTGFDVHHIDDNKSNNNLNNLALLSDAAHTRLHNLKKV